MKKPHKHAAVIKAWADGATIQIYRIQYDDWVIADNPTWSVHREYRVNSEPLIVNGVECAIPASNHGNHPWEVTITVKREHQVSGSMYSLHFDESDDAIGMYHALIKPFKTVP